MPPHRLVLILLLCLPGCARIFQRQARTLSEVLPVEWRHPGARICVSRYRLEFGQVNYGEDVKEELLRGSAGPQRSILGTLAMKGIETGVRAATPVPVPQPFPVAAVHGAIPDGLEEASPFGARVVCGPRDLLLQAALAVAGPRERFDLLRRDGRRAFTRLPAATLEVSDAAEDEAGCVRGVLLVQTFTRRFPLPQRVCPRYAALASRARALLLSGDPLRAEPLLRESLALRAEARGHRDAGLAPLLLDLGDVAQDLNRAFDAARLYRQALEHGRDELPARNRIAALYLGQGEPDLAAPEIAHASALGRRLPAGHKERMMARINAAALLQQRGLLHQAEAAYREVLPKDAAAPDEAPIAALLGLGRLYLEMGQVAAAGPLLQRASARLRDRPRHRQALAVLEALATYHVMDGHVEQARSLLRSEGDAGENPERLLLLARLAAVLGERGEAAAAEEMLLDGVRRARQIGGPVLGELLAALGACYAAKGDLGRAAAALEEALQRHGARGTWGARLRTELAAVRLRAGHPQEALPLLRDAFAASEAVLRHFMTESRMERYLELLRIQEDLSYSLLLHRRTEDDPAARRLVLTVALLRKGRTEDAATRGAMAVLERARHPQVRQRIERLLQIRGALARAVVMDAAQAEALDRDAEALEQDILERTGELRALPPLPDEILEQVRRRLPRDGALLEIAAFRPLRKGGATWGDERYAALLLFPDGRIGAADLGERARIDEAVAGLRRALRSREVDPLPAAQAAHRLLMQPLLRLLGGIRHLHVSPDGPLNLLPFGALHDGRGYLIDTLRVSYLTSGRDLLRRVVRSRSSAVLVLADPDLPRAPGEAPGPSGPLAALRPLPGTRAEAAEIARLLPAASLLIGGEATEEALLGAAAPRILHVASHGVFLDEQDEGGGDARGLTRVKASAPEPEAGPARPPEVVRARGTRAALSRSALVLAGAGGLARAGGRGWDGLATALEVAGMDLRGTQLVVLSACDTGRGDVRRLGQGVYGLRRAFLIAGAQTVVASLWQVSDQATRDLMVAYYRELLAGRGRAEAMQQAALALRASRPHPHDWAPFVVIGNEGPLQR